LGGAGLDLGEAGRAEDTALAVGWRRDRCGLGAGDLAGSVNCVETTCTDGTGGRGVAQGAEEAIRSTRHPLLIVNEGERESTGTGRRQKAYGERSRIAVLLRPEGSGYDATDVQAEDSSLAVPLNLMERPYHGRSIKSFSTAKYPASF
jgi:hypothetical protein